MSIKYKCQYCKSLVLVEYKFYNPRSLQVVCSSCKSAGPIFEFADYECDYDVKQQWVIDNIIKIEEKHGRESDEFFEFVKELTGWKGCEDED